MAVIIPYVKQTWTDGVSSASAARFGVLEDGVYDAHHMPAARAFAGAATSVPTATLFAIGMNSERFDTDTIHDTATNNSRLTCKHAGKYMIVGSTGWAVSAAGNYRQAKVRLNGTTILDVNTIAPSASHGSEGTVTSMWDLAVNDYVELCVQQDSGGNLNLNSAEFSMARVA